MSSIHTTDLLAQKSQIQIEMSNLEKTLAEKKILLWFLENLIKQAQMRDSESQEKSKSQTQSQSIRLPLKIEERNFQKEVLDFLNSQIWKSARASSISDALSWGTRDGQQKISNALTQLIKLWEVEIAKEYDSTGSERQRNRLYQLTNLV
jgi:hypothetical protein